MAADRQRLAQALAAEAARRRLFESIPEAAGQGLPQAPETTNYGRDLENLSIGLGRGAVNQMEGMRQLAMHPVESVKGMAAGVAEAVRNPKMIAEALKKAGERATRGPLDLGEMIGENMSLRPRGPVMHELDVYHGSPHVFDEFDASKIGTGEGAQAYGHGIYLAESPKVAASYRSQLAPGSIRTIDGKDYDSANPEHIAAKYLNTFQQKNYLPQKIANILEEDANITGEEKYKKAAEILRNGNIEKLGKIGHRPSGALYHADLPDEMVDWMLDWDKTMKNQPAAVKAALRSNDKLRKFLDKENSAMTGAEFHNWAQDAIDPPSGEWGIQKTSQELSRILQEAGIPGIKYKDAGSRGQRGTGTRNFVVFPGEEKKVKILKRE